MFLKKFLTIFINGLNRHTYKLFVVIIRSSLYNEIYQSIMTGSIKLLAHAVTCIHQYGEREITIYELIMMRFIPSCYQTYIGCTELSPLVDCKICLPFIIKTTFNNFKVEFAGLKRILQFHSASLPNLMTIVVLQVKLI